jgi:uncharacterized repeat protein (TIGR01451 family)
VVAKGRFASMRLLGAGMIVAVALFGLCSSTAWGATSGSVENENAVLEATCTSASIAYRSFPNLPNNVVTQTLTIHGAKISKSTFTFNGPTGTDTIPIAVPPGTGNVDIHATWNTNGFKGHFDLGVPLECPPGPSFSIAKRQEIVGGGGGFTASPLTGKVGQTVDYEIVVTNTGNIPLTFSDFTDEHCEDVTGGPGAGVVAPRASTTYFCSHVLTEVGSYENSASDTATPPAGDGSPVTQTSNTVVVNVPPEPSFAIEKLQEVQGSATGFTTSPLVAEVGQTVDYEIVVTNTGNVPLTFSEFTDEHCENLTGGPGAGSVAPGASTTYFCNHVMTIAKPYRNTATDTGTPPVGDGSPITQTSNTVEVVPNPGEVGKKEGENGVLTATCSSVSITYRNFPNKPDNTVTQTLTIHGAKISKSTFTFNGPTGTDTIPIVVPPGTGVVDIHATWNTNGFKGHFDLGATLKCTPEPEFSIDKLQEISGSGKGFTASPLTGKVGQTVDYEIVVTNTGNVALTFSAFTDENCEDVTGGPGATQLALGASATYLCNHVLAEVGRYSNTASDTATPPPGDGSPVTQASNTVVVEAEGLLG